MSAPNRQGLPTVLLAIQPNEHLVLAAITPAVVRNEAQRQSLHPLRLIPAIERAHLIHHAFTRRLKYTDAAEGILDEAIGDRCLRVDTQTLQLHSVVNTLRAVDQRPAHDGDTVRIAADARCRLVEVAVLEDVAVVVALRLFCRNAKVLDAVTLEKIPAPVCQRVAETAAQRTLLHFLLFFHVERPPSLFF